MNLREIAYLAIREFWTKGTFTSDILEKWERESLPTFQDARLAKAITYGCIQRALSLDAIAGMCTDKGRLSLKAKERAIVHLAIYQLYYLDKIPEYAAVNEAVILAKKYCHPTFCRFLNAILRKITEKKPLLFEGQSIQEWSRFYSYPPYLIEQLLQDYDKQTVREILRLGNDPAPLMYRKRFAPSQPGDILGLPLPVCLARDDEKLTEIANSPEIYIQNATPVALITRLAQDFPPPNRILDLCCAPGGKLIAAHDLFPKAHLYGNDVSESKVRLISENINKYQIQASLSCFPGENYIHEQSFDLILLDVPCSNTGVLNKRPEARWRITAESLTDLKKLQLKLIENAVRLLSPKGQIWLMTCSILSSENKGLAAEAAKRFGLKIKKSYLFLPNEQGWDGGFGCALSKEI